MRTAFGAACILFALLGCAESTATTPGTEQVGSPLLALSTPAAGATVAGPVNNLQLKFAEPVRLIEVTLDGPDGLSPMMVTAARETTDYSIPLLGLSAGKYRVNWRASVSARPYNGAFTFTIRD